MNRPTAADAIRSLRVDADFAWTGTDYAGLVWHAVSAKPTEAEIAAELARLDTAWRAAEYQRQRSAEYPGLDALVEALWEAQVEGRSTTAQELQALREAVKLKYPKPA